MVDLFCLGVKDSYWFFNKLPFELSAILGSIEDEFGIQEISYDLAHNIIFAGYEYAQNLGISACKEFESVTRYFLEEDDEKIPLIHVETGDRGKPHLIAHMDENPALLEKNCGEDGFLVTNAEDDLNEEDSSLLDMDDEALAVNLMEYYDISEKEALDFLNFEDFDDLEDDEMVEFIELLHDLYYLDHNQNSLYVIQKEDAIFEKKFSFIDNDEKGIARLLQLPKDADAALVHQVYDMYYTKDFEILDALKAKYGHNVLLDFMEIPRAIAEQPTKAVNLTNRFIKKYADTIFGRIGKFLLEDTWDNETDQPFPSFEILSQGITHVTQLEYDYFVSEKLQYLCDSENFDQVFAFENTLLNLVEEDEYYFPFLEMLYKSMRRVVIRRIHV